MTAPVAADADVYIAAVTVDEIFADPTYQRLCDVTRVRKMAHTWDRRLAGILEVSDRGDDASPRYAVIDGQHRWAAAKSLQTPPQPGSQRA
jgi:phage FluMu gp28-like protein